MGIARVEDRAVGALVFDDDVALAEHPFGEKRRDRARSRRSCAARRPASAPARDRACCRGARTCCPAARGCRARACAPSGDSRRTRWSSPFRFRPDVPVEACCRTAAGGASRARLPCQPPSSSLSSDSISRTMRSESSDCRTIVSRSSEIACGSRSEIEFWCSTSSSDSMESSSVTSAFTVPSTSDNDASSRRLSSRFFLSAAAARSGTIGLRQFLLERCDLLFDLVASSGLPAAARIAARPSDGSGTPEESCRACRAARTDTPARCPSSSDSWLRSSRHRFSIAA